MKIQTWSFSFAFHQAERLYCNRSVVLAVMNAPVGFIGQNKIFRLLFKGEYLTSSLTGRVELKNKGITSYCLCYCFVVQSRLKIQSLSFGFALLCTRKPVSL